MRIPIINQAMQNLSAFLDMIAWSEGTKGKGDDGYNVVVGGTLFSSYTDHPRKLVQLRAGLASTAAGRYQLLAHEYDAYRKTLYLSDFCPAVQDVIAIQQIKECKAIASISTGYIKDAIDLCAHIWASFPHADYGQRENKLQDLLSVYKRYGGNL